MRRGNVRGLSQQIICGLFVLVFPTSVAYGATYYVRTDGNNASNGLANTAADAWRTIDWAADHVAPGDVVRVQTGTYVETVTPGVSGTSANTVTLVADGAVTICGMAISSRNYLRVIGLTMDGDANGCTNSAIVTVSGANTGLEFWHNTITNADGHGFLMPNTSDRCHSCIIIGGSITDVRNNTHGLTIIGDDVFVGYVSFDEIAYLGVVPSGHRMRFVNLNFARFLDPGGSHPDFFYIQGSNDFGYSDNLIESIYGLGEPITHNKAMHWQNQTATNWEDNIWRQSLIYGMGSGFYSVYDDKSQINRLHFYNNTIVGCNRAPDNNTVYHDSCGNFSSQLGTSLTASVNNSIHYNAWADLATSAAPWAESSSPVVTKDYNLAYSSAGTITFHAHWKVQSSELSNINPGFVNASSDWTLQSGSAARGAGGRLTTASGSGSSSTSLTVAPNTGSFFVGSNASNLPQYGGAFAAGDFITVGSKTVQVASRSGDTLTLASPISWNNGDPVYFGTSAIVDIGAYPYKLSGYALSAHYSCSAGTCTIQPSDASLVRFVVCYDDGVPYAVDNVSPYACAAATGTFSARAYPRYASKTLWTTATSGPLPPSNVRIVP